MVASEVLTKEVKYEAIRACCNQQPVWQKSRRPHSCEANVGLCFLCNGQGLIVHLYRPYVNLFPRSPRDTGAAFLNA